MTEQFNHRTLTQSILRSYTQVFFSDKLWFGVLILIVSFFDWMAGLSGLIAVLVTNLFAWWIGFNTTNIKKGYYGFNSLLVGLGLGLIFAPGPEFFLVLIFISVFTLLITVILEGFLGKYGLPFLSIPFLFGIWLVTLAARLYTNMEISERGIYALNEMYSLGGLSMVSVYEWFNQLNLHESITIFFRSMGAIFFQYHLFPGIVLTLGLLIYSRIAFSLSVLGFFSAYLYFRLVGADITELSYAYIGFNYILTAIAVGGFFIVPSRYSYLSAILLTPLISIVLSATHSLFVPLQLSIYSLPFNFIVILFLYALKLRSRNFTRPEIVSYQQGSPEANLYYQSNNRLRFGDFVPVNLSLPFWGKWKVTQAHNGNITHKKNWQQAWDFEITDANGNTYKGEGHLQKDYYCWDKPVVAPADGWIEQLTDQVDDNAIGEVNLNKNWGNTIVIRHTDQLFSAISHLKKESILFKKGDYVKRGDTLARCGNSGRSPYPHIHFQLQSTPQIGSGTIDYPMGHYLLIEKDSNHLKSFARPKKGESIQNIEVDTEIRRAFNFVPGQRFILNRDDEPTESHSWEVEADIYNNTYLYCQKTGAKAYYKLDNDMFFFTQYKGEKSALLYSFFLASYKVVFSNSKNVIVEEAMPINLFRQRWSAWIQDFIAPFHFFLKASFKMSYKNQNDKLNQGPVTLNSRSTLYFGSKVLNSFTSEIIMIDGSITHFTSEDSAQLKHTWLCSKE